MFIGCVVSELRPSGGGGGGAGAGGHSHGTLGIALSQPVNGYVLLLVQATCNNFAAVFTERMLKSTPGQGGY